MMRIQQVIKYFLAATTFFILGECNGQTWGRANSVWYYSQPNQIGNPQYSYNKYFIEKDTTINGKVCKKIANNFSPYFMYEESDQVYYWFNDSFHLIYDFNAATGDTVNFDFLSYSTSSVQYDTTYSISCVLEEIDSILINSTYIKTFDFKVLIDSSLSHITWISRYKYAEQIGYFPKFMVKLSIPSQGGQQTLRCYQNDFINFVNPWWAQFQLNCDFELTTSSSSMQQNNSFELNTFLQNQNFLEFEIVPVPINPVEIRIYDFLGKLHYNQTLLPMNNFKINITNLPSGIYWIHLNNQDLRNQRKFQIK